MATGMITSGGINRSTLAADIRELKQLMTDGILSKEELKEQVKALIASNKEQQAPNYQHQHVVVNNNNNPAATAALESKKNYRNGRSPDTLMIRNIIAGPICRRFRLQCAKPDSVLWGTVPPRRLNQKLFKAAAKSPLEQIFTRYVFPLIHSHSLSLTHARTYHIIGMPQN